MNRRSLLSTTLLIPVVACTGMLPTTSQLASDAQLISSGLSVVVTNIQSLPGVTNAALATLGKYLAAITANAAALASQTVAVPATLVQEIVADIKAFAPVALAIIPGGSQLVAVVQAALALISPMLAAVGITATSAEPPRYAPEQAKAILKMAVAKR